MSSFVQNVSKLFSVILFGAMVATGARAYVPSFVNESLYSPNVAFVAEVLPSLAADVVILDGGLEQGIRLGVVCRISRGVQQVGELIIIETSADRSAALILDLNDDYLIQVGDLARIKTLQNS